MKYSIFTKPWQTLPAHDLCKKVSSWGFDGVEFPLRDGYQVEPKNAEKELSALAKVMSDYGLSIMSVASSTEENIFAACQTAGVPIIRIMGPWLDKNYKESDKKFKKYLQSLVPLCEKYGVTVGIQNHNNNMVSATLELRVLLEGYDPKCIGAIWDAAHSGLCMESADKALDIIWDKLILVNLKNAYWKPRTGPEAPQALFDPYFTSGKFGMANYADIIKYLKEHEYKGDICLPAEFSDGELVEELAPLELQYVKRLFSL
ncbi:MAG: sugar phosphate isomerase/epimerase [Oscillospiraceae bacterium]|jgi:sugar phosphate isomerase/epimerase|nr:sugar phosphate isomerase/epimerase [Oscillospiraceae bacterium]